MTVPAFITARDHVKAIQRKCGASNRGELVADHIRPDFEESAHRSG